MAATTPTHDAAQIIYPERDGKPMAETDLHRQEMIDAITTLTDFFRDSPDVYVAGNLLLRRENNRLRLIDAATGERLLRPDEVAAARHAEAEARRAAEERLAATEAELAQLPAELARLRGTTPSDDS